MSEKIYDAQTYGRVARFLPDAIAHAISSYRKYQRRDVSGDDFAEYHKSLRIAVAHIELLLKLARVVLDSTVLEAPDKGRVLLATLMREAEGEIRTYHVKSGDGDE